MLQMTKEQLQKYRQWDVYRLYALAQPILSHRADLYRMYARKASSEETMSGGTEKSRKQAIVAFEYYIVNMVQGYLGGKAPMYSIRQGEHPEGYAEQFKTSMERIRRYNDDAATYIELIHDYLITTAAYLYVYEDEWNETRYVRFDSRQTVAVYDYATPPNPIGCIRCWNEQEDSRTVQVIEVMDGETRTIYRQQSGNSYSLGQTELLSWGDVPIIAFEHPDGIAVFEPALSPIATYEQLVNNVKNMTQYNDDAKLLISGYNMPDLPPEIIDENGKTIRNPEREAFERQMMEALTLFVGEGGDIRWLLKEVDYSGTLAVEKSLHDLITMLTGVPNMTDEAFANADNASALGYKLYALDQYSATTDRVFRKGYLRLWELIAGRLNMKGSNFDFRDIDILMQRNIPTDRDKSIARAATMKQSGLFSDETCINESSVEVDAKEEIERRDQEQETDLKQMVRRNQMLAGSAEEAGEPEEGVGTDEG